MQRAVIGAWLLILGAGTAAAQAPSTAPSRGGGPLKIAFIRSQEILSRTPGFATAESTLSREVAGFRTEVQKLEQQLDSAVRAYDQQAIALSPAAKQAKQRELQQLQQRYQQRSGELQEKAAQRQQELLAPINARIRAIIDGLRAEENYSIIFDVDAPGGMLVAADPALNITARVIQRLQTSQ